jgi:iron-sulfur cluster assembly accessory protein
MVQSVSLAREATPTAIPDPSITLTARAADMVRKAAEQEGLAGHALRVGVVGGGCSGLQYLLDFVAEPGADDFVTSQHGVQIFVDPFSAGHLAGTTIDYVDSLQGSGFKFENPNIVKSCGCGSSFQT